MPPAIRVRVGCPLVLAHRAQGVRRAFFHVGHVGPWTVCTVEEAGKLPESHLYGLVLHELGHPLAWKLWNRSRQQDADAAAFRYTGIPILYRSGLVLQWVTTGDVARIKLGGSRT